MIQKLKYLFAHKNIEVFYQINLDINKDFNHYNYNM